MNPSLLRDHSWHEACVSSQFTRHLYCPGGQPSGLPEAGCHTGPPVAFGEVSGELLTGFACLSRSVCTYSPELFVCLSQLGPSWVLLWSHSLSLALACADGLVRIWPSAAVLRVRVPGVQQGHPSPQPLSLPGRFHVCPAASFLLAALLRWPWSLLAQARAEGALLGMEAVWTRMRRCEGWLLPLLCEGLPLAGTWQLGQNKHWRCQRPSRPDGEPGSRTLFFFLFLFSPHCWIEQENVIHKRLFCTKNSYCTGAALNTYCHNGASYVSRSYTQRRVLGEERDSVQIRHRNPRNKSYVMSTHGVQLFLQSQWKKPCQLSCQAPAEWAVDARVRLRTASWQPRESSRLARGRLLGTYGGSWASGLIPVRLVWKDLGSGMKRKIQPGTVF